MTRMTTMAILAPAVTGTELPRGQQQLLNQQSSKPTRELQ
jgi:hypothetical protein